MKFILFLSLVLINACTTTSNNLSSQRAPSNDGAQAVDWKFINSVLGKRFEYVAPKVPDGGPNCVAAALRAGNYLPVFALNGTDDFYEKVLPKCFVRNLYTPNSRDIGVIYNHNVSTLAHMVVFTDKDEVFEKASPNNYDLFKMNSWEAIKKNSYKGAGFESQVWTYKGGAGCALEKIKNSFAYAESAQTVGVQIEERIINQSWDNPIKQKDFLTQVLAQNEEQIKKYFEGKGTSFDPQKDYADFYTIRFFSDIYKTLLRTPNVD